MNRYTIWALVLVNIGAWCFSQWLNNENSKDQYELQQYGHYNQMMILDMQIRTFHYTKPHKHQVRFCPECSGDSFAHLSHDEIMSELRKRQTEYEENIKRVIYDHNEMESLSPEERAAIWKKRMEEATRKWDRFRPNNRVK